MTTSPPDPIAAIAELAGQLDALSVKVTDVEALVSEHDLRLGDLETSGPDGPAVIAWHELDEDEYAATLAALTAWVEILIANYPAAGRSVAPCWQAHKDAVTDLGVVWCEFTRIYARKRPLLADALPYWDRWLPGALKRVGDATKLCRGGRGCTLGQDNHAAR